MSCAEACTSYRYPHGNTDQGPPIPQATVLINIKTSGGGRGDKDGVTRTQAAYRVTCALIREAFSYSHGENGRDVLRPVLLLGIAPFVHTCRHAVFLNVISTI